jgi:hypothetical protein
VPLYKRSIMDAMEGTAFSQLFDDASWNNWKVYLRALFGLPMTDDQAEVFRQFTGRTTVPTQPFKESALVIGRRGGKSRTMAWVATYLSLFRDYRPYLAPGEKATVAIIASDRKQARSIFRYITGVFQASAQLKALIEDENAESLTLKNRVVIEIATASFRVTRGYTFAAVLADETAYWRDETSQNPDVEIFRALRPGMASIPGALLINASSPYRRSGVLWQVYRDHFGKDDAKVLVWQASTEQMNSRIDPDFIAEEYEKDPESARCEFGADFRSDLSDFIPRGALDAVVEYGCYERAPNRAAGRRYVAFLDAAGGSGQDSMTMAIAHAEDGVAVLDAIRERRPPFNPDSVTAEFAELARGYGIYRAEADKWGGEWVGQAFRKHGITVIPSAKPKSQIYLEALPLIMSGRCSLLENKRLITQLTGLERRTVRGGKDSIDHGPKGHDDCANAACGALVMAGTARPPMKIDPELLARI